MEQVVKRGQVFFAELQNDGTSRQSGIRPVIVCSNDMNNRFSPIITVVSLTSRKKHTLPTHVYIAAEKSGLSLDSIALCEQPLSISKANLKEYVCSLNEDYMLQISNGLKVQLAL